MNSKPAIGLVPARGGSKRVARKNIKMLAGVPLIAHTIIAAKNTNTIDSVIVSKDDDEIAESARSFGAEVPFLRPADLSGDNIGVVPEIRYGVDVLETSADIRIRRLVHLHPTSPLRKSGHIDDAVNLHQRNKAETIVGVTAVPHQYPSEYLFEIDQDCRVEAPGSGNGTLDRREKKNYYARNRPSILLLYRSTIAAGVLYGADTHALVMSATESIDLDTADDFDLAEYLIKKSSA